MVAHTPRTRILIDTATFKSILDKHPEIEMELMDGVHEKIAEELKRKIANNGRPRGD